MYTSVHSATQHRDLRSILCDLLPFSSRAGRPSTVLGVGAAKKRTRVQQLAPTRRPRSATLGDEPSAWAEARVRRWVQRGQWTSSETLRQIKLALEKAFDELVSSLPAESVKNAPKIGARLRVTYAPQRGAVVRHDGTVVLAGPKMLLLLLDAGGLRHIQLGRIRHISVGHGAEFIDLAASDCSP